MRFLFLNPFAGGSHRDFARGLIEHSRHDIDEMALPGRFWKWRMRGAALYFIQKIDSLSRYDGIIATDMMGVADFKALAGEKCPPILLYFHENQITYPLAPGEARDFQFGFTNIIGACAADRILFNSKTHFDDFFTHLPGFLKMMPEFSPMWVADAIREKSGVLYPGVRFPARPDHDFSRNDSPPLIIWNHRWEFDKNPGDFFEVLEKVQEKGHDFRLALLGENFQKVPKDFIRAREVFGDRIVCDGYAKSRRAYIDWLRRGSVAAGSARQENFGISVVEAARRGCLPLVPSRLSYPEIIPEKFHTCALWADKADFERKLIAFLKDPAAFLGIREEIAGAMGVFSWENLIGSYDRALEDLASSS
ncbi:Glycosyl transferase family 1 [Candidatus Desulfarcum epimagneticum]|uniref:tRNA-queuosine alpha-mannosyltransferase n=1 Tax=uncultured Desulfobacteraceae bacterium TaxID=218296 RepID=A0A484HGD9_9BACT|nr:Glycosyl transferase family 1 [uncultured Desulfobacteraceae bacterium]